MFTPRLKKPEAGNKYYIKKPSGYNPCKKGNPTDKDCNVLANCVGYATGRFSEETNEGCCRWFGNMDAKSFYIVATRDYNLEVGQTPKVGAIACWQGGSTKQGHVAIVEKVVSNTEILTSESAYGGKAFYTKTRKKGNGLWGMSSKYKFQGFVYNPNIAKITKPVERNTAVDQLEVIKSKLRIRTEPSLKGEILGFAELGYYNDLETKEADGYIWHKVAENNWLAEVEGYVILLPTYKVGDKVVFKQIPDYFIITGIENTIVNVKATTSINNLEKID